MDTDRYTFSVDGRISDPNGTFPEALEGFLAAYSGTVGASKFKPTTEAFHLLNIREKIIQSLIVENIDTVSKLTSLTFEEIRKFEGIDWIYCREIVCSLHSAKLALKDAPPEEDSLELLPISSLAYKALRESSSPVFRLVGDITRMDKSAFSSALGHRYLIAITVIEALAANSRELRQ